MKIKAIIFDKDGVLVDSEESKAIAWQRTLERYDIKEGYSWYLSNLGPTSISLAEKSIKLFKINETPETVSHQWQKDYLLIKDNVQPIKRNLEVLSILSTTYLIGVASSMDRVTIETEMLKFGYRKYIHVCVSGEDVARNKPSPDVYLKVAEMLKVKPSECIAIEDSPTGISAAKTARMLCIGFKNPLYNLDLSQCDIFTEDLGAIDFTKLNNY